MASNNSGRAGNTNATAFTGLSRPMSITPDAPGNISYMLPSDTPYRSRKTVEVRPEGRTGPYTPDDNKMRILFPTGKQCGYADFACTGKLHFDLTVTSDKDFASHGPTWAFSKISAQGLISRARLYQVENDIEDMRYYNYFQQYLVKPFVVPSDAIFAESCVYELDVSKHVAMTVDQAATNYGTAKVGSGSLNSTTVPVAMSINLGFLSEPVLQPLPHLGSALILEIDWAPYNEAFLDWSLTKVQNNCFAKLYAADQKFRHLVGHETTYNPNIPASDTTTLYSGATAGTYVVNNVRYRYEEVYVDADLDNRIKTRILSADGLVYHYESHIQDQRTWGGNAADMEFTLQLRSLKQAYAMTFESGAQIDSWAIPQPWMPGFETAQWEIATSLWPQRPYTRSSEVFDALNSALGVQQTRLINRLVTSPNLFFAPGKLADGTTISSNLHYLDIGRTPYYISPIHNSAIANSLPFQGSTDGSKSIGGGDKTSLSAPDEDTGISTVVMPDGFAWGIVQLTAGDVELTLDAAATRALNPIRLTSASTYANIGSIALVGAVGGSSNALNANSMGTLYFDDYDVVADPQTLHIKSTNAAGSERVEGARRPLGVLFFVLTS
jgi:hypothetical protein